MSKPIPKDFYKYKNQNLILILPTLKHQSSIGNQELINNSQIIQNEDSNWAFKKSAFQTYSFQNQNQLNSSIQNSTFALNMPNTQDRQLYLSLTSNMNIFKSLQNYEKQQITFNKIEQQNRKQQTKHSEDDSQNGLVVQMEKLKKQKKMIARQKLLQKKRQQLKKSNAIKNFLKNFIKIFQQKQKKQQLKLKYNIQDYQCKNMIDNLNKKIKYKNRCQKIENVMAIFEHIEYFQILKEQFLNFLGIYPTIINQTKIKDQDSSVELVIQLKNLVQSLQKQTMIKKKKKKLNE